MVHIASLEDQQLLLKHARNTIEFGSIQKKILPIKLSNFTTELQIEAASFVTLTTNNHNLRGCIGSLEASMPLILDVTKNAYAAAFQDPRFAPCSTHEIPQLKISISILSKPELLKFTNEADLLSQIRPNIDGLILSDIGHKGTFLPSVWEQLTTTAEFWQHLKLKANLPINHWSQTIQVQRYTTQYINE